MVFLWYSHDILHGFPFHFPHGSPLPDRCRCPGVSAGDAKRQKGDGESKGEVMSLEQVLAKRKEENKAPGFCQIWAENR